MRHRPCEHEARQHLKSLQAQLREQAKAYEPTPAADILAFDEDLEERLEAMVKKRGSKLTFGDIDIEDIHIALSPTSKIYPGESGSEDEQLHHQGPPSTPQVPAPQEGRVTRQNPSGTKNP